MTALDYFSPEGILSKILTGFTHNPGQERMAALVEQSLADNETLLLEAGTGTGKTFAYLIPAIESRRRVVISTATKALQEQLIEKDIPFLQDKAGLRFEAVQMKGRGNYLCHRRLELFLRQPTFEVLEETKLLSKIVKWAERTETGDRAELAGLPESLKVWDDINASAQHCAGRHCKRMRECFITKLRARAAGADLVIVNHHLFFADLSMRDRPHAEVIPRYEAVVFDEAHQIESIATEFFGLQVSNYRYEELVRDARVELERLSVSGKEPEKYLRAVSKRAKKLLSLVAKKVPASSRVRIRREEFTALVKEECDSLCQALEKLGDFVQDLVDSRGLKDLEPISRRAGEISQQTQLVLEMDDPALVYWCERRERGIFLSASPIDVSGELATRLHEPVKCLLFTSATLSTGGTFEYFRSRTGIQRECIEEIIPSHFDFHHQGLLYLPRGLPEPRNPKYPVMVAEEIRRILEASRGRALVLFTSIRNMREVYGLLQDKLPYVTMIQGERPKTILLSEFRTDVHSVLFATTSFWQGVDVQGEALSCVIIDKIPFDVPSDPIVQARIEKLNELGENPFFRFQVPEATITLKQGMGRLIRNRFDRGVVAICDVRLKNKPYGKTILASLPDFPVTEDISAVADFFMSSGPSILKK